jgi:hypothetical protein
MQMLDASADAVIRRKDDGSLRRSLDLDSLDEVFWRIDGFRRGTSSPVQTNNTISDSAQRRLRPQRALCHLT